MYTPPHSWNQQGRLVAIGLGFLRTTRQPSLQHIPLTSRPSPRSRKDQTTELAKWGFKLWVLADMSGYTTDFNIYTGKSAERTDKGLSHDVVMELVQPFAFQGYQVYVDNFYSSPDLFTHLLEYGITVTGTLRTTRRGVQVMLSFSKKLWTSVLSLVVQAITFVIPSPQLCTLAGVINELSQ